MDDVKKPKIKWLEKLKNVKHIEIYIIAIFAIIIVLICMSSLNKKESSPTTKKSTNTSGELTVSQYVENMENNLESILSKIKGASDVSVMITLDNSSLKVKDNIVSIDTFPSIKGIMIVAKGVENTYVKMNILKAVEAVIDVKSGNIEILVSN